MQTLSCHRDVLDLLGVERLAAALNSDPNEADRMLRRVRKWRLRNRIAANWIFDVAQIAHDSGHRQITPKLLHALRPRTCTHAGEAA